MWPQAMDFRGKLNIINLVRNLENSHEAYNAPVICMIEIHLCAMYCIARIANEASNCSFHFGEGERETKSSVTLQALRKKTTRVSFSRSK